MNSKEFERMEKELCGIREHMRAIHDDVLILKTQRDVTAKFVYMIAGGVSLVISMIMGYFWR